MNIIKISSFGVVMGQHPTITQSNHEEIVLYQISNLNA